MTAKRTRKTTTPRAARGLRPVQRRVSGFTAKRGDPAKDPATWGCEYKMNRIPVGFWRSVQAKAKRDGISLRGLLLTYLADWLDGKRAA